MRLHVNPARIITAPEGVRVCCDGDSVLLDPQNISLGAVRRAQSKLVRRCHAVAKKLCKLHRRFPGTTFRVSRIDANTVRVSMTVGHGGIDSTTIRIPDRRVHGVARLIARTSKRLVKSWRARAMLGIGALADLPGLDPFTVIVQRNEESELFVATHCREKIGAAASLNELVTMIARWADARTYRVGRMINVHHVIDRMVAQRQRLTTPASLLNNPRVFQGRNAVRRAMENSGEWPV